MQGGGSDVLVMTYRWESQRAAHWGFGLACQAAAVTTLTAPTRRLSRAARAFGAEGRARRAVEPRALVVWFFEFGELMVFVFSNELFSYPNSTCGTSCTLNYKVVLERISMRHRSVKRRPSLFEAQVHQVSKFPHQCQMSSGILFRITLVRPGVAAWLRACNGGRRNSEPNRPAVLLGGGLVGVELAAELAEALGLQDVGMHRMD